MACRWLTGRLTVYHLTDKKQLDISHSCAMKQRFLPFAIKLFFSVTCASFERHGYALP
jgi:hypothetical protein